MLKFVQLGRPSATGRTLHAQAVLGGTCRAITYTRLQPTVLRKRKDLVVRQRRRKCLLRLLLILTLRRLPPTPLI
jgi:hypothetical protein